MSRVMSGAPANGEAGFPPPRGVRPAAGVPGSLLYAHWKQIPADRWMWSNFTPQEIACRHCGEIVLDQPTMDAAQLVRSIVGKPVTINSGHRCAFWNVWVGGAPLSQHRKVALDMSTRNHERGRLLSAARQAGFKGYGFYTTFLHVDMGRRRSWFGSSASKEIWDGHIG